VLRELLVDQAERVRKLLVRQRLEAPVAVAAGQIGRPLAAPVEYEDARRWVSRREVGGGGVRDVVRDEADVLGIEAGQRGLEKERRTANVERAEALPRVTGDVAVERRGEVGVVRVADRVEVGGREPRARETPRRRLLRQLPGREGNRRLPMLAPVEALLLGRRDDLPVDDERGRGVVKDGVDP
jgi:hypothetical protein